MVDTVEAHSRLSKSITALIIHSTSKIESLSLELEVNGEIRQAGGYELMMHKPADILAEIKTFMSLEDGDIVMTGTPKGVGPVNPGEIFTGRIKSNLTILLEHSWVAQ